MLGSMFKSMCFIETPLINTRSIANHLLAARVDRLSAYAAFPAVRKAAQGWPRCSAKLLSSMDYKPYILS